MWVKFGIFGSLGMLRSSGFLLSEAGTRHGARCSGWDPRYIGAGTSTVPLLPVRVPCGGGGAEAGSDDTVRSSNNLRATHLKE